jgi:WD40 repeat protein
MWNFNAGECIKTNNDHSGIVNKIELISNDTFATCSSDKTIKLFNLNTPEYFGKFNGHKDNVWDIIE